MGDYSVPAEIRAMKPRGTMVKAIRGRYYVYEYKSVTEGGKRRTRMGPCVGSITSDLGFVPNSGRARQGGPTTLEFGQYALALAASEGVYGLLKEHFHPADAAQVYACAVVMAVNGAAPMKDAGRLAAMSILSLRFPSVSLSAESLSRLLDDLGRRQAPVTAFEGALCEACGPEVAIDGHAVASHSARNDLCEAGYKRARLGSEQVNLLMAFDTASCAPVISRVYEGAALDRSCVSDLLGRAALRDKLFVLDSGFYSAANLAALSRDGCSYVIPLHKGLVACKEAVADPEVDGRFVYRRAKRASVVEYRVHARQGRRVILYRDLNKQALEQEGYLTKLGKGARGYTAEGFEGARDVMGVIVLQTSAGFLSPQEVYEAYKRRWRIETFYDWLKNTEGFTSLGVQDYCRAQGLAFLMLVASLVRNGMRSACEPAKGKSVGDCLLDARMVKANLVGGRWTCTNLLKRQAELFEAIGVPMSVEPFLPHT